jgi:hypothetical protein
MTRILLLLSLVVELDIGNNCAALHFLSGGGP